jgi:glycosyltransferase involved in cell wall biosynthesis
VADERVPVSIVVPSRDRPERLRNCVTSVRAAMGPDDELIVVDSASVREAEVKEAVADLVDRLVRLEQPGVNRARNAGWRAARHDIVLFTDDDVVVDPGWADAFARTVAAHPDAGFVTGRIDKPPHRENPRRAVAIKRDPDPAVFDRTSVVNLGHGASMATRREVLARIGGWDESLGAGSRFRSAPEVDLFDRILRAGWLGRYEPESLAYHEQWRDMDEIQVLDYGYGIGQGARLSKLLRADRPRFARATRVAFWDWGLQMAIQEYRRGARKLAKASLLRVGGTVLGFFRGLVTPVVDGHFRPRGER